jgi:DNA invertase Pin-like site-specific DNA recombinase
MIYGYIRVSTSSQTVENQKIQIKNYCREKRLHNVIWFSETISGTKMPEKRKLGELLKAAKDGDTIIVTEVSRLGRSMMMIMNVLDECLRNGVKVVAIKENFVLDNSIACKALMFSFGLSAEIERTLISERTKAGLERARKRGKKIGRALGEKPHRFKLTPYKARIRRYIKEGRSLNSMAKEFGVRWTTMRNFCKVNIFVKPLPPLTEEPKKHGHPTHRELARFKKN